MRARIKRLTTDEEGSKKATSSRCFEERERESRGMKTGKGVNGGVSGWKKRARTEHSRRRCRRPMKKSLVAPAGLANILLSNTGATHTHPHSVHPSRNHYTVPFLSRGVANGGGKEETRGEETGRKSMGERGKEKFEGTWPRGCARLDENAPRSFRLLFFRRDDAGCIAGPKNFRSLLP